MSVLDEILAELASIRDRLQAEVDAAERAGLVARQDELRARAREAVPEDPTDLQRELERLKAAWERLQRQRIDVVKQAGGGSSGGDFGFAADAQRLNRKIDEAGGREFLERRIAELKARLAEMEDRL